MKRLISILLILVISLSAFAGCKGIEGSNNDPIPSISNDSLSKDETTTEFIESEWGVYEELVTRKNSVFSYAYIRFPTLSGINEGTGKIAYQKDETLVILDAERIDSPSMSGDSCECVFPALFEQTKDIIDAYRQLDYNNFEFSVESKENVTVNDYDMCKFIGKHTFTRNDEKKEMNFVAYSAQLKANGAYVYWMVLDESEDQNLTKTIEEYADKMAKTLHE
jgi:hypothetical protein